MCLRTEIWLRPNDSEFLGSIPASINFLPLELAILLINIYEMEKNVSSLLKMCARPMPASSVGKYSLHKFSSQQDCVLLSS